MNDLLSAAIYAPLGAVLVAVISWLKDKRKGDAEVDLGVLKNAQVVQGMALEMLQPLRDRINRLESLIQKLESEVESLSAELKTERQGRIQAESERDLLKSSQRR
jgi:hypothetical protein